MRYRVKAKTYISFELYLMDFEGTQIDVFDFEPDLERKVSISKQACQFLQENKINKLLNMSLRDYRNDEYSRSLMFKITILDIQEL